MKESVVILSLTFRQIFLMEQLSISILALNAPTKLLLVEYESKGCVNFGKMVYWDTVGLGLCYNFSCFTCSTERVIGVGFPFFRL